MSALIDDRGHHVGHPRSSSMDEYLNSEYVTHIEAFESIRDRIQCWLRETAIVCSAVTQLEHSFVSSMRRNTVGHYAERVRTFFNGTCTSVVL